MLPLRILGANCKIDGQGLPGLSVRFHNNVFYSAWEPTPEELVLLNSGGRVILACAGIQPYVVIKAIETNLEYADYKSPYFPKAYSDDPDWKYTTYEEQKEKKKRGRPKKQKTDVTTEAKEAPSQNTSQ